MAELLFWMSAFIPKTVAGYTKLLTGGTHHHKTAVPLPWIARTWPGNSFKALDAGYLTDQRSFDNTFGASHRMCSFITIETSTMKKLKDGHTSSGTTEVHLDTGDEIDFAVANTSRCEWSQLGLDFFVIRPIIDGLEKLKKPGSNERLLVEKVMPKGRSIRFTLDAAAGDPLVGMAADIDFTGVLTVSQDAMGILSVEFDGLIDAFPAYEAYASYKTLTKTLFVDSPPPGNTVANLLGVAERRIKGSASFAA